MRLPGVGASSVEGDGTSPPAMESSWFCSASICFFRARTWRSWLVVKSVIFVMAEFVMWGGVGSQTRKWVGLSDWDNGSNRNWRKTRDFCFDRESWTKYVSLTVVIIAVVGSIAAQWSGAAFTGHASRSTQLASSSSAGMRYPTPQGSSLPSPQHKSIQGLAGTPHLKSLPAPARGGSPSIWNDGPSPLRV